LPDASQFLADRLQPEVNPIDGQHLVFLPHLKRAERGIAARIKFLASTPPNYPAIDAEKAIAWCQTKTGKDLASSQQTALKQAVTSRVLIITGGRAWVKRPW